MSDAERYDQCEWNFSLSTPRFEGEGCTNRATTMVGAKVYVRVCDRCAGDPVLKRYTVRRRILGSSPPPLPPPQSRS
jgi:hypothetical protein